MRVPAFGLWLSMALPLTQAHAAPCAAADEAELRRLKLQEWPRIYREQDVTALRALLLDGALTFDAEGVPATKQQLLAWVAANPWTTQEFVYRIDSIGCFRDTAIVAGEGTSLRGEGRERHRHRYVSSNVFVKHDGRWRVAGSHISGVRREAVAPATK